MADGGEGGGKAALIVSTEQSVAAIAPDAWQRLDADQPYNPFTSHAFLSALETSNSVGERSGWIPRHLLLNRGDRLVAAAPAYLKLHSRGEYIFDHHWADAYERAGGSYFPKLIVAAPFTPATGPRLLAETADDRYALAAAIPEVVLRLGLSSAHVNFVLSADDDALDAAAFLPRDTSQYHWFNKGYRTFDDYLHALSARKRKAVKREREGAADGGLVIRTLAGRDLNEAHWDAFWSFYQDTGARKWGTPYLTREFFSIIGETMRDDLVMFVAESEGRPVAGALNFLGGDCIYGRYWGCTEHHPFLHFELCYYRAIEFAIERGLARVEAGAQGEHKIARGYEPVTIRSRHFIADAGFRRAIADYLDRERRQNADEIEALAAYAPFRKGQPEFDPPEGPE